VPDHEPFRRRQARRFDDEDPRELSRARRRAPTTEADPSATDPSALDAPPTGDRWSTWDQSAAGERGPKPYPDWLVTELAAVDTELGVLKTGKEADVHLLERAVPEADRRCLLAAKRYRSAEHRMFHRDAGYLEGRRVRRSRETRAMARRTSFGRDLIAGQWARAEFGVLCRLYTASYAAGSPVVPYPVQLLGTEVLMEFIGDPGTGEAAPRLAQLRPSGDALAALWEEVLAATSLLARLGLAHGDLSPFNILVHDGRPVLIDLPQVVDVVANPRGPQLLARDARVVTAWFAARGLPGADPAQVTAMLLAEAGVR
jgi:RIO kinase 1